MAQKGKALATKSDDLRLIPTAHKLSSNLDLCVLAHTPPHTYTHTQRLSKHNKIMLIADGSYEGMETHWLIMSRLGDSPQASYHGTLDFCSLLKAPQFISACPCLAISLLCPRP